MYCSGTRRVAQEVRPVRSRELRSLRTPEKTTSSKRSCRLPGGRILEKTNARRKENGSLRFINKKSAPNQERTKELLELKKQIRASQTAILSAQNQFEQVVDPALIDCYIYELNAAQLRYQFLLQSLKKRELQEV